MITIQTPFRKLFLQLLPELQEVLSRDLGFLNLETEKDQADFVQKLLRLNPLQQKKYAELLRKKQASKEYLQNVKNFADYFQKTIKPKAKKLIQSGKKKFAEDEKRNADFELAQSLKNV